MLRSGMLLLTMVALGLSAPARSHAGFIAYNDSAWAASNATGFFTTVSPLDTAPFSLVSSADGSALPAQATWSQGPGGAPPSGPWVLDGGLPPLPPGSDAYDIFNPSGMSVDQEYMEWSTNSMLLTFSGLSPTNRYTCVYFGSRNSTNATPNYLNRLMDVTLSGALAFTNRSSVGVTRFTTVFPDDSVTVAGGVNTNGLVVKFTDIAPGADGTMALEISVNTSLGGAKAYANAFMLEEYDGPPVTNVPSLRIKMMPIGDSITQSDTNHASYRYWLWKELTVSNSYDVDFIGPHTMAAGGGPNLYSDFDPDHAGYWGWASYEINYVMQNALYSDNTAFGPQDTGGTFQTNVFYDIPANVPDIALIHLGHNNVGWKNNWGVDGAAMATNHIAEMIDHLRSRNPSVVILLCKVTPVNSAIDSNLAAKVEELQPLLPLLAEAKTTTASPVVLVD